MTFLLSVLHYKYKYIWGEIQFSHIQPHVQVLGRHMEALGYQFVRSPTLGKCGRIQIWNVMLVPSYMCKYMLFATMFPKFFYSLDRCCRKYDTVWCSLYVSAQHSKFDARFAQVWKVADAKHYCLPQRRNRVWGVAILARRDTKPRATNAKIYEECLTSMKTSFQFPADLNFPPAPRGELKDGRHRFHVENAKKMAFSQDNIFVDVSGSEGRPCISFGVPPCITPAHPVWSVRMERYLNSIDFLNTQALWQTAYSQETYEKLLLQPKLCQSLAGNSFAGTVAQAAFLSSLGCVSSWDHDPNSGKTAEIVESDPCPQQSLMRIRSKRKAPEFDNLLDQIAKKTRKVKEGKEKKKYLLTKTETRNKGKKLVSTIWNKEQVTCP